MSDSHDNIDAIKKAVNAFNSHELDLVIHAGDLISPFTAQEFKKLDSELVAIYGNNDGDREGLKRAYKDISSLEDFKEISVGGCNISIIHGTNQAIVDALAKSGKYDVVVRGHTHRMEILDGKSMVMNPGETCGYLSGQKTVILLETDNLSFEVIHL